MKWNNIDLETKMPIIDESQKEMASSFLLEMSDFETEEFRRRLFIRIANTIFEREMPL